MDAFQITKYLIEKSLLPDGTEVLKKLQGGTVSELYLLAEEGKPAYVIKSNEPAIVESEAFFLQFYKGIDLLPQILFQEKENNYIIYHFLNGEVLKRLGNKRVILSQAVTGMLNRYKEPFDFEGWGWKDEPVSNWEGFILSRAEGARAALSSILREEDFEMVAGFVRDSAVNHCEKAFLLHGDFGIHNFLITDGRLAGVIDPTPVIGPPLYDLLYAFCSTPEDLTAETLLHCAGLLTKGEKLPEQELYREVMIVLYIRMATSLKHHPEDFSEYQKAWDYWKSLSE